MSGSFRDPLARGLRVLLRDADEKHPYSMEEPYEESYESQHQWTVFERSRRWSSSLAGWSWRKSRPQPQRRRPPHGRSPQHRPPSSAARRQRTLHQPRTFERPQRSSLVGPGPFLGPILGSLHQPVPRPFRRALPERPAVRTGRRPHRCKRDEAAQARHAEERAGRSRRPREEPQAGDRHRAVRGALEGGEGSASVERRRLPEEQRVRFVTSKVTGRRSAVAGLGGRDPAGSRRSRARHLKEGD